MSQSKSLVIPFIILAVLIFGGALAWKTFFNEPEQVVVKPQPVVIKKAPPKVVAPIEKPEVLEEEEFVPLTKEEYEVKRKEQSRLMRMEMRYLTPEPLIRDIEYYQKQGNQEMVDELIDFLVTRYPNYKLPKSLGK